MTPDTHRSDILIDRTILAQAEALKIALLVIQDLIVQKSELQHAVYNLTRIACVPPPPSTPSKITPPVSCDRETHCPLSAYGTKGMELYAPTLFKNCCKKFCKNHDDAKKCNNFHNCISCWICFDDEVKSLNIEGGAQ